MQTLAKSFNVVVVIVTHSDVPLYLEGAGYL